MEEYDIGITYVHKNRWQVKYYIPAGKYWFISEYPSVDKALESIKERMEHLENKKENKHENNQKR
jgi:hypothetical protein